MKTKDEVRLHLCEIARDRIKDLGMTQNEVANLTGFKQSTISEINCLKTDYGIDSLITLLEQLGISIHLSVEAYVRKNI